MNKSLKMGNSVTWKNASVYFELEEIKNDFVQKIKELQNFDKDNIMLTNVSSCFTGYYVTVVFTDDNTESLLNDYIDYLYKKYADKIPLEERL